jgi:hypothetical protein
MKTGIKLLAAAFCFTLFIALPQRSNAQDCGTSLVNDLQYELTLQGTNLTLTVSNGIAMLDGTLDYSQVDLAYTSIQQYINNGQTCNTAPTLQYGDITVLNNDQTYDPGTSGSTSGVFTTYYLKVISPNTKR